MPRYEYIDKDDYRDYIVKRAQTRLLYKSNEVSNKDLVAVLNGFFDDAYNIIVKWRRLKTDDEFLSQKWDDEITEFVVDSYRTMGDETLNSKSINGVNKSYRINPTSKLKSRIPQVV